jgi:hypothetical protein
MVAAKEPPAPIQGTWDMLGKQKVKVVLDGKSEKQTSLVRDVFDFQADGEFWTVDGYFGTWTQNGTAFSVLMDIPTVEAFAREYFTAGAPPGMDIVLSVTTATLAGKENGPGTKLSGKGVLSGPLEVTYLGQTLTGAFASQTAFKGTRASTKGTAEGLADALLGQAVVGILEAVEAAVGSARP